MCNQPHILAPNDGVVDVVFNTGLARAHAGELTGRVTGVQVPNLGGNLRGALNNQVLFAAYRTDSDPVGLIGLMEDTDVILGGGAHAVTPHGIRPPGFVDLLIEDPFRANPGSTCGDARNLVVKQFARAQILYTQRVALVACDVGGVGQQIAVRGDARCAEGEEVVAFGQLVGIQDDLFSWCRGVVRNGRWRPRGKTVTGLRAHATAHPVRLALLRA